MTWSAATVDQQIAQKAPNFERRYVTREREGDGYPQVAEVVPKHRIVTLAQDCGVSEAMPSLRKRWTLAAAAGVLVVGAAATAVNGLLKAHAGSADLLYLALGAVAAVLVLAGQEVSGFLKRSEREAARSRVLNHIRDAAAVRNDAWKRLVDALVRELETCGADRCVIVDAFDRLDSTTRATLREYLRNRESPSEGRELWVVFEESGVGSLSNDILLSPLSAPRFTGPVRLQLVRQVNLDEAQRGALATELRAPDRADFRRVKWIAQRDADAAGDVRKRLSQQRESQKGDDLPYGPLEIVYLLAIGNTTGPIDLGSQDLISELSTRTSAPAAEVLKLVFPGAALNRSEVAHALDRTREELPSALDVECLGDDRLEVVREYADVIVAQRAELGFEAPAIVHLFWALFWFSRLGGADEVDNAYELRKLGRHLISATPPSALGERLSSPVRARYTSAATWSAQRLLRASIPDDVVQLLERAERESTSAGERRLLRSVCWEAFAVLGSGAVLQTILRLHPGRTGAREIDNLDQLFIDSMSLSDAGPSVRRQFLDRLRSLEPDVRDYARARALWLALVTHSATMEPWTMFARATGDACARAAGFVDAALGRLADSSRSRATTDAIIVSIGVWCYGIAFANQDVTLKQANDLLEDVRLRALQVQEEIEGRGVDGAGTDFVLRALLQEIDVIVSASAAAIRADPRVAVASPTERDRLDDHVRSSIAVGSAVPEHEAIVSRMSLQALIWLQLGYSDRSPLGFDQLASLMTLRRVHLGLLFMPPGTDTTSALTNAMSGLSAQLDGGGSDALMAYGIVTQAALRHQEISGLLLVRGVENALDSWLAADLETELSLLALSAANAFHIPLRRALEYLLRPWQGNRALTRFQARAEQFDDETRTSAALWLLNAAHGDEIPFALADAVTREVVLMGDGATDDATRDAISERVDVSRLTHEIDSGTLDTRAEIERWAKRTDSSSFGFVLHLLMRHTDGDAEVLDLALKHIRTNPNIPVTSGPIFLAVDIVRATSSTGHHEAGHADVLEYLERTQRAWEPSLTVETNVEIIRLLLSENVGQIHDHIARLNQFELVRQERDGLEKLPALVAEGRFFLVLWHYYETLSVFGLQTEPATDWQDLVYMSAESQADVLAEWHRRDGVVPPLVVHGPHGKRISGDFVRYGRALFRGPHTDTELDGARGFNDAVGASLGAVYEVLIAMGSMPDGLRRLLNEHRLRLARPRPSSAATQLLG